MLLIGAVTFGSLQVSAQPADAYWKHGETNWMEARQYPGSTPRQNSAKQRQYRAQRARSRTYVNRRATTRRAQSSRNATVRTTRATPPKARTSVASNRLPVTGHKVQARSSGTVLTGVASYYWQPQPLASGGRFNPEALTAAHRTLPFGTRVRVTNKQNGKSVVVVINDRGPYIRGRIIDLSRRAATVIGMRQSGLAPVSVEVL